MSSPSFHTHIHFTSPWSPSQAPSRPLYITTNSLKFLPHKAYTSRQTFTSNRDSGYHSKVYDEDLSPKTLLPPATPWSEIHDEKSRTQTYDPSNDSRRGSNETSCPQQLAPRKTSTLLHPSPSPSAPTEAVHRHKTILRVAPLSMPLSSSPSRRDALRKNSTLLHPSSPSDADADVGVGLPTRWFRRWEWEGVTFGMGEGKKKMTRKGSVLHSCFSDTEVDEEKENEE